MSAKRYTHRTSHHNIISPREVGKRVMWIPQMSKTAYAVKAVCVRHGIRNAKVLPETDDTSLMLAREQLSGDQCLPCFATLGDFLRRTKEKDFSPRKEAFFQATASGPCRYGQYIYLQRQVLDGLGLRQVPIATLSSQNAYGGLGVGFKKDVLVAVITSDYLYKLLWRTRPYERQKGETDKLFEEYISRLEKDVVEKNSVFRAMRRLLADAANDFEGVEKYRKKRPLIGVVGEIYVRWNAYCNGDIVRRIEEYGGEAWIAPFLEWVEYLIELRKQEAIRQGKKVNAYQAQEKAIKMIKWTLWKPLSKYLKARFDDYASTAMHEGERYVDASFGGETILTLGKAAEMNHAGAKGIVNIGPFACMPTTVVAQMSRKFRKDHGNMPFLNMTFDGNAQDTAILRAFIHQCRGWKGYSDFWQSWT